MTDKKCNCEKCQLLRKLAGVLDGKEYPVGILASVELLAGLLANASGDDIEHAFGGLRLATKSLEERTLSAMAQRFAKEGKMDVLTEYMRNKKARKAAEGKQAVNELKEADLPPELQSVLKALVADGVEVKVVKL